MHEQIETAQRLNVARLLPNTPSFIENHFDERGKSVHATAPGRSGITAERPHFACGRSRISVLWLM
jgi:hypothetical protein